MHIIKRLLPLSRSYLTNFAFEVASFSEFLFLYSKKYLNGFFLFFEKEKNLLVRFLLMKRGKYNRTFLHIATIGLLGLGVMIAPVLTDTLPIFSTSVNAIQRIPSPASGTQSVTVDENVFNTVSSGHRGKVITYTVEHGDTLTAIAQKFDISVDTIKWANNLTSDEVSVGDQLQILPVSGVLYKVESGDTVYSIADKLKTNAQKIVDFPFNDFANPETFSLVSGQDLVVPDGIPPTAQSTYTAPTFIASAPTQITFTGTGFNWPIQGLITQGYSWYHKAIDIAGPIGTPIYAAKAGVVMEADCGWNYGYGCHVLLSNGGGWSTMYAHMVGQPPVATGDSITAGQLIGYRGDTGNSTGPHTHFEIRSPDGYLNPLSYLP
ncbi:MAG TPA: M23 family metallopeptidase [Patescibacteria group bacterium]|nr:M23 family metallopeptidase [Patescibacteria group bacterium]